MDKFANRIHQGKKTKQIEHLIPAYLLGGRLEGVGSLYMVKENHSRPTGRVDEGRP